jgi:subtilase family serine protease
MRLKLLALIAGALTLAGAAAQAAPQVERSGNTFHVAVCAHGNPNGTARCHAHVVTDRSGNPLVNKNRGFGGTPSGLTPAQLRAAYGITGTGSSSTVIAIVDAYGYGNAESDLNVYRTQFGLPACRSNPTTPSAGCFMKVNENGQFTNLPKNNSGWDQEQALDLDMVSAMCPNCRILLVQAASASFQDLATAENTAAAWAGVQAVSNSYGGNENGGSAFENYYNHAGIAITVSTGDSGYGAEFPATSPHVIATGGTSLNMNGNTRVSETAWSGAGSGCSSAFTAPSWQAFLSSVCGIYRAEADVSAVADPNTGVAVYGPWFGTYPAWLVFGGTSVAAPLTAGVVGVGGPLANAASGFYTSGASLHDITSGSNGNCGAPLCTAQAGWDGPTGLGTPSGSSAY